MRSGQPAGQTCKSLLEKAQEHDRSRIMQRKSSGFSVLLVALMMSFIVITAMPIFYGVAGESMWLAGLD